MKVYIYFAVLVAAALAGPAKLPRRYFPEEDNPYNKRFIYVEDDKGGYKLVDLALPPENGTVKATVSDVTYHLFTRSNTNSAHKIYNGDVNGLQSSPFNPAKTNIFVVHGWNNNAGSSVNTLIHDAIFGSQLDVNLFVVDWSGPAGTVNYISAKGAVDDIGLFVGNFINQIQNNYGLSGSSFILIGHSLGAHVVGCAGAAVKSKIGHIIGLDPAGPLFTISNTGNRLDPSDGNFVQVIHTNGALLGFSSSIGHVDYYPNGGMNQPGCIMDLAGTCAHGRSYRYLAESISRGAVFQGVSCSSYDNYENGLCSNNNRSPMGLNSKRDAGDYYFDTNSDSPYGRG